MVANQSSEERPGAIECVSRLIAKRSSVIIVSVPFLLYALAPAAAEMLTKQVTKQYFRLANTDDPRKGFLMEAVASREGINFQFCNGEQTSVSLGDLLPELTDCNDEPAGTWFVSLSELKGATLYTEAYIEIGTVSKIAISDQLSEHGSNGGPSVGSAIVHLASGGTAPTELPLLDEALDAQQLYNGTISLVVKDELLRKLGWGGSHLLYGPAFAQDTSMTMEEGLLMLEQLAAKELKQIGINDVDVMGLTLNQLALIHSVSSSGDTSEAQKRQKLQQIVSK